MKPFKLTIQGRKESWDTDAYEPFEGAAFVVHKGGRDGSGDWLVAHRKTTWIAHYPDDGTRRSALAVAERLSKECPSADKVGLKGGAATGPHQKLREEIVAALRGIGESLPRGYAA